ncbi:MAG: metallophosphoesterase [Thermofilum sp.]
MAGLRALAFADVHAPRFLPLLSRSLRELEVGGVELVLVAGDVVEKGEWRVCSSVEKLLERRAPGVPVVAVFGNEDYEEVREKMREECPGFRWLEDAALPLDLPSGRVVVVGTTGSLDRPTRWQERNVPGVRELYRARLERVEALLKSAGQGVVVLLTHYPPRCRTLEGEDVRFWPEMSSRGMREVVERAQPDAVVHGHLHESRVHRDFIGSTPVFNVSLPAVGGAVVLELRRRGLSAFL